MITLANIFFANAISKQKPTLLLYPSLSRGFSPGISQMAIPRKAPGRMKHEKFADLIPICQQTGAECDWTAFGPL